MLPDNRFYFPPPNVQKKRKNFSYPYPPLCSIRNANFANNEQYRSTSRLCTAAATNKIRFTFFPQARVVNNTRGTRDRMVARVEGIFDKRIAKEEQQKEQVCTSDPGTGRNG